MIKKTRAQFKIYQDLDQAGDSGERAPDSAQALFRRNTSRALAGGKPEAGPASDLKQLERVCLTYLTISPGG